MMKKNILIILTPIFLILSCKDKTIEISEGTRAVKPVPQTIEPITKLVPAEKKKYVYNGLSFRDPFLPSQGERLARARLGLTKDAVVPSLGSLSLKGIIEDQKDKIALFTSPYGSYMFVNGKLYDNQNRLVKGITGKIVFKDSSGEKKQVGVILITEENYYKEFYLKQKVDY
jgi:hypothetical protein